MSVKWLILVPLAFAAFQAQASERCVRATRALTAGSVPSAQDLAAADCGDTRPETVVRYDTVMRAARLTRDVQSGEVVAEVPPALMAGVSPGQKLFVTVQVGPVLVQREVEALQPANPGQKLFVRAADGQVMSVMYAGEPR